MAADYKRLLLKSVDKIAFAGFLVFFLVQAFKFVTTTSPTGENSVPRIPDNKSFPDDPTLFKERFVLRNITNPMQPDARNDITTDPEKIEPGPGEKQCPRCGWIVPREVQTCPKCKYSWTGMEPTTPNNTPPPPPVEGIPFRVLEAAARPVGILFKGFFRRPGGHYVIQINWADDTRTSMVPVNDFFQEYKLVSLKKEEVMVKRPGFPRAYPEPRYILTIEKKGREPVRIEEDQTVTEDLPVATFQAVSGKWQVQREKKVVGTGQTTFDVYAGDSIIEMGGEGREFEVLQVTSTRVVLEDKDGKKHELPVSAR